jgi:HEAT repeat protein
MGEDAKEAIPELISRLDNRSLRFASVSALNQIGPTAKSAIPAIRKILLEEFKKPTGSDRDTYRELGYRSNSIPDRDFIEAGISTLIRFGPESVSTLTDFVENSELSLERKIEAVKALAQIGPEAKDAANVLKKMLKDKDPLLRIASATALWRIQKDDGALAVTRTFLKATIDGMEKERSSAPRRSERTFTDPLTASLATDPSERERLALRELIIFLGEMGPSAKEWLPDLRKLLSYQTPSAREATMVAIQKINPGEKFEERDLP